jgi:hypothetical protein
LQREEKRKEKKTEYFKSNYQPKKENNIFRELFIILKYSTNR